MIDGSPSFSTQQTYRDAARVPEKMSLSGSREKTLAQDPDKLGPIRIELPSSEGALSPFSAVKQRGAQIPVNPTRGETPAMDAVNCLSLPRDVKPSSVDNHSCIQPSDNAIALAIENLKIIFQRSFITRRQGSRFPSHPDTLVVAQTRTRLLADSTRSGLSATTMLGSPLNPSSP